jgi:hypothetical protein
MENGRTLNTEVIENFINFLTRVEFRILISNEEVMIS